MLTQSKPRSMHSKPFPAYRRAIALELKNLLAIRRTMARLRRELAAGRPADELLITARGKLSRGTLLAYAQTAYRFSLRNVCLSRRVLFQKQHGAGATPGAAVQ